MNTLTLQVEPTCTLNLGKCEVRTQSRGTHKTSTENVCSTDMDHHIGDVHSAIVDKEIEIIQSLQEKVLTFKNTIGKACDICAELDCLLSFAEASRAYNFKRPSMLEDAMTYIKQGRYVVPFTLRDLNFIDQCYGK